MFGIYVDKHLYLYTLKRPQIFYHNVHTVELALPPPHTLSVPHTAARVAFLGPNGGGGGGTLLCLGLKPPGGSRYPPYLCSLTE